MPTVPDPLLGQSGPGVSITVSGKTWTLTRSTKKIQAAWSKWLVDRAEARVLDTADKYRERAAVFFEQSREISEKYADIDPSAISAEENAKATAERDRLARKGRVLEQEARNVVERFNDRVAAGEYEYFGNVAIDLAQQNLPGQIMLIYLCLLPKHPDVTLDDVTKSHMPDENGNNHIQEWREALLVSEGVKVKKGVQSKASTENPSTKTSEAGK